MLRTDVAAVEGGTRSDVRVLNGSAFHTQRRDTLRWNQKDDKSQDICIKHVNKVQPKTLGGDE